MWGSLAHAIRVNTRTLGKDIGKCWENVKREATNAAKSNVGRFVETVTLVGVDVALHNPLGAIRFIRDIVR